MRQEYVIILKMNRLESLFTYRGMSSYPRSFVFQKGYKGSKMEVNPILTTAVTALTSKRSPCASVCSLAPVGESLRPILGVRGELAQS